MQVQQVTQPDTWVTFAIESVKILGPAAVALIASWIALRYQQKLKVVEIDAQMRLKARELMFQAYQTEVNTQLAELKEFAKTLQKMSVKIESGVKQEMQEALLEASMALTGMFSPTFASVDRLERELKEMGIADRFQVELANLRQGEVKTPLKDVKSMQEILSKSFMRMGQLVLLNQELLAKKRELLFKDYLPQSNAK